MGWVDGDEEKPKPVSYIMGWPYYEDKEYKKECKHEYINVGFYTVKMVCKFCDKLEEEK